MVVGLFGGVASGKSRVGALLAERGAAVLDADRMAHAELGRPEVRDEVAAAFGPRVLDAAGGVDRRALAAVVFEEVPRKRDRVEEVPRKRDRVEDDRAAPLSRLEAILHPRVMAAFAEALERAARPAGEPRAVVVLDAPLLAEAGGMGLCDEVLFVEASAETRRRRARERGWAEGELERREARQLGIAEKRTAATFTIDNDGDLAATAAQVGRFWRERIAPRGAA